MEDRIFAANELADLDKKISRQNTESAGNLNEWLSGKWSCADQAADRCLTSS